MEDHPKEAKMNFRKFQLVVVAGALGGAAALASAQQAVIGAGTSGSTVATPAAAKTATDIQGNAALSSEVALSGTPRQGKPGTQSGVAVTDTRSRGAGPASYSMSSQSLAGLSSTQMRELERYKALR
jgi:hypothetical protein